MLINLAVEAHRVKNIALQLSSTFLGTIQVHPVHFWRASSDANQEPHECVRIKTISHFSF